MSELGFNVTPPPKVLKVMSGRKYTELPLPLEAGRKVYVSASPTVALTGKVNGVVFESYSMLTFRILERAVSPTNKAARWDMSDRLWRYPKVETAFTQVTSIRPHEVYTLASELGYWEVWAKKLNRLFDLSLNGSVLEHYCKFGWVDEFNLTTPEITYKPPVIPF